MHDGEVIRLEPGITLKVIGTPGHSCDELSYLFMEKHCIFVGDTIPVKGDIPIWINKKDSTASLKRLAAIDDIDRLYPAWDVTYEKEQIAEKIQEALELIDCIQEYVNKNKRQATDLEKITECVCQQMGTPEFLKNSLFRRTIASMLSEIK